MKVYKYKLYNSDHDKQLSRQLSIASHIYNHCIALHKRYYQLTKKYLSSGRLQKHITKLKKKERFQHWNKLNSQTIQDIVQRIDKAYQNFFKKYAKRPPTFKSWRKYNSITFKQTGYKLLENGKIRILKKNFKCFNSREFEGKVKTITIKRDCLGDFYICITTDHKEDHNRSVTGKTAGFDFGLKTFLVNNYAEEIKSPLFLEQSLNELKITQRQLSSKKKGSKNKEKARLRVARLHRRIVNQRRDWHYKLANTIVNKFDEVYFESLNIEAMKRLWGRKVSDLGFSSFLNILEYKCVQNNVKFIKIGRFEATSKICNSCGYKNTDLELSDREWVCPSCGEIHDRDVNAAKNIYAVGASTARGEQVSLFDLIKSKSSVC
ncbi:MAG: RNA-guided endonuclease InsQ/TnpB family protein [Elusimicrobiota bacterium]